MEARLIDVMGTDLSVVNAARVSFNRESFYNFSEGFADLEEKDARLIKYLATTITSLRLLTALSPCVSVCLSLLQDNALNM